MSTAMRSFPAYLVALLTFSLPVSAATIQVGPSRTYTTIAAGVTAAAAGDTIEVDSGTYVGSQCLASISKNNLTIRGVGPTRPVLNADSRAKSDKGLFVIIGSNTTIENLEFKNCSATSAGGWAGICQEGANLSVRNCSFHDNQNGILAGNLAVNVLIEACEFYHNGLNGSASTHNINIGSCLSLTLQYCYVHDVVNGHEVKTLASVNNILYNRIGGEQGNGQVEVYLARGGTACIIGNLIVQGPNSQNAEIITYGREGTNANPYLYVINNTIVNLRSQGAVYLTKVNSTAAGDALVQNNILAGLGGEVVLAGNGDGPTTLTANWQTTNPGFADAASGDFHLTADSTGAIGAGADPGMGYDPASGLLTLPLTPIHEYTHPCSHTTRPVSGTIDIGAYEYHQPNTPPTVGVLQDMVDAYENMPVSLHAIADDPDENDVIEYTWSQVSGQPVVNPSGEQTADYSFTAPSLTDRPAGTLVLRVQASDSRGGMDSRDVTVNVRMAGDANHDWFINVGDLQMVVAAWGSSAVGPADFGGDGYVNVGDLQVLVANWGRSLP